MITLLWHYEDKQLWAETDDGQVIFSVPFSSEPTEETIVLAVAAFQAGYDADAVEMDEDDLTKIAFNNDRGKRVLEISYSETEPLEVTTGLCQAFCAALIKKEKPCH